MLICLYLCFYGGVISLFFFFKQKTAYEMRISDWSSDVCSSDLEDRFVDAARMVGQDPASAPGDPKAIADDRLDQQGGFQVPDRQPEMLPHLRLAHRRALVGPPQIAPHLRDAILQAGGVPGRDQIGRAHV